MNNTASRLSIQRFVAVWTLITLLVALLPVVHSFAEETATVTAKVILRKSADKDSKALQTLPEGEEVTLLGVSGSWYKVNYGKYTGYVMKKYVKTGGGSAVANADKIAALGDAPGALHIGDQGNDVKKLQQALKILGYYSGKIDGDYGTGTTDAVTLYQTAHKLEADGIAGKGTIKEIFGSCAKKADVTLCTDEDAKTTTSTATSSTSTSTKSSSSSAKTVSSLEEIGSTPSTSREGDSGTKVVKLQQALHLLGYYAGDIDGDYGAKTVAAVKRFQKNRGMKQDGIAGQSTIRVLFSGSTASTSSSSSSSSSSSDKTYKTEVLDWFADNVSSVIPKNAKFTIKDVRTGKTFKAVRWSGVNHLDAEPASSDDTATMKAIYGGAWSWNRRPILILYNGHVYAASMNGMPHGTSTISNGFDGHFCIHFKNSKTHGTKKVDPDHQSAVNTASRATW